MTEMAEGPVPTGPMVTKHGPVSKFGPCTIGPRDKFQIDRSKTGVKPDHSRTVPKFGLARRTMPSLRMRVWKDFLR